MKSIFFTADTHFNRRLIINHCKRPFKSIEEMNETLIANWNSEVKKNDIVYHLGDFGESKIESLQAIRKRLNGKIILIQGNHDPKEVCKLFDEVHHILELKIDFTRFILCHYSMYTDETWPYYMDEVIHLFGHSHGRLAPSVYKRGDVGVDVWDYFPVHIDYIFKKFENILPPTNYVYEEKYLEFNREENRKVRLS